MQGADADALAGTDAALMQGAMLTQMQWLIILLMLMLMTGSDAGGVLATLKSVRPQSFSKRPWPPAIEICAPLTTTNTPRVKLNSIQWIVPMFSKNTRNMRC